MSGQPDADGGIAFGPFRLLPARHLLLEGETEIALGGRAFDILLALLERAGEVVGKEALIARAWPNTVVEEGNLRLHIAALRRALSDGVRGNRYITTIAGRGYSFVAPVRALRKETVSTAVVSDDRLTSRLSYVRGKVIGRTEIVRAVCTQVRRGRFITLVGEGGIGKTTIALAIAQQMAPSFRHGATLVDLSHLEDPRLVPAAFATAFGLALSSDNVMAAVIAFLKQRETLLVVDNCEHVIEAAAAAAEELYGETELVHIIATSREPLRAAGERVHRLIPLESPTPGGRLTAADAASFSSVQLFVERAEASMSGFTLTDANASAVADICRRLDGMPLAIELAAGQVAAFGVAELAMRLDDRLALLTSGRRTALPRHRTLAATLDWSYRLLPEPEQKQLLRLAVFVGDFALDSAIAVAPDIDTVQFISAVAGFVQKSLIVADLTGSIARYRLLETTRLYSIKKLKETGGYHHAYRRLANYLCEALVKADFQSEAQPTVEWLAFYVDNVRVALEWAYSDVGDASIGITLVISAVPLWVRLSRMNECRVWAARALRGLSEQSTVDPSSRMQLSAALGWSLMYSVGRADESRAAWETTLEDAQRLGDTGYRLRAMFGLWINHLNNGEFRKALDCARSFADSVTGSADVVDLMMADRILGTSLHYSGDQTSAGLYLQRMLDRNAAEFGQRRVTRLQFDERVTANYFHARILWLQGSPDRAMRTVEANIAEAEPLGHALSFASVLGQGACPISLLRGNLALSKHYGTMLRSHAERFAIRLWGLWARGYLGVVLARQGDLTAGLDAMRAAFDEAGDARFLPRFRMLNGEFATCLALAGDIPLGLETVDTALKSCQRNEEGWYVPELMRIKAEIIGLIDVGAAESHFKQAVSLASGQGARSWQLRAATGLASLWRGQGQIAEARALLAGIYDSFSEGFETLDLQTAHHLLAELG